MSEHRNQNPTPLIERKLQPLAPLKRPRPWLRRTVRLGVLLAVVVGGGGYLWQSGLYKKLDYSSPTQASTASQLKLYTVKHDSLRIGVTESGQLRAVKNYTIKNELRSPGKIAYVIAEGAQVRKGREVLLRFEVKMIEDAIVARTTELEAARRQLTVAQESVKIQESDSRSMLSSTVAQLKVARESLKRFTQLDAPKAFRDLENRTTVAHKAVLDAEKALRDSQTKRDEQMSTDEEQVKAVEAQIATAKEALRQAKRNLDATAVERKMYKAYDYPRDLEARKQQVERSELDLTKARVAAESNMLSRQAELNHAKYNVTRLEKDLAEARAEVGKCVTTAPADGMVLYGDQGSNRDYWRSQEQRELKIGTEIYPGSIVLTIPDLSAFEMDIQIGEEHRGKLNAGCKAIVTMEAIPGLVVQAELKSIDKLAQPRVPWDRTSPKVFTGVIRLQNADPRMVSGMSAKVEIVAMTLDRVLTVPIEAVFNDQGKAYCYVACGDGQFEKRQVAPGQSNDDFVEITYGVREGEQVCLILPSSDTIVPSTQPPPPAAKRPTTTTAAATGPATATAPATTATAAATTGATTATTAATSPTSTKATTTGTTTKPTTATTRGLDARDAGRGHGRAG